MKISKEILLSQGKQSIEDRKVLETANLDEMEIMSTLRILGSVRFLQRLCNEKNKSVHDLTPELIIKELKDSPRFTFN